jgi:hypothetical protein
MAVGSHKEPVGKPVNARIKKFTMRNGRRAVELPERG